MPISPITVLYFFYLINIFISCRNVKNIYKNLLTITCILEISMLQGYALRFKYFEISLLNLHTIIFILTSLFLFITLIKGKNNKNVINLLILIVFYGCLQIAFNLLFPYTGLVLDMSIRGNSWDYYAWGISKLSIKNFEITYGLKGAFKLFYLLINAYLIKQYLDFEDFKLIASKILNISKIIMLFGLFEFLLKNILKLASIPYVITSFIFGESTYGYTIPILRGGIYALEGFSVEPSYFNTCIFSYLMLLIIYNRMNNNISLSSLLLNKWFIIGILLMFFSGGISCIWCIAMLAVEYYLTTRIIKNNIVKANFVRGLKYILGLTLVLIILYSLMSFMNSHYITRINNIFITLINMQKSNNVSSGIGDMSAYSRFLSIKTCFDIFLNRPLFGLGAGFIECHDSTVSFLVQFGFIGFAIWLAILLMPNYEKRKYDISLLLICIIIAGIPFGNPGSLYSFIFNLLIVELSSFYIKNSVISKNIK